MMYGRSAAVYDALYEGKDYAGEAERLHALIQEIKRIPDETLLDVACGTGGHIGSLRQHYVVEGMDLSAEMLDVARRRHPDIVFHQADMIDFDLGRQFGAVVCLFSAIGYMRSVPRLRRAIANLARHALPGGVIAVEPWFTPDQWNIGYLTAQMVDKPDVKIARMSRSDIDGSLAIMDMHHLVATPDGVEHFVERHEMGLFSHDEYLAAFEATGVAATHDAYGLFGRGLYIGTRT
jgi:ubiquinone/menaquinone biosynthesis C-methylase UbiE